VAVLNCASKGLNQICDLENDRVNKPRRPLHHPASVLRRSVESARAISPSFIQPWLILAAGVWLRVLTRNGSSILALSGSSWHGHLRDLLDESTS